MHIAAKKQSQPMDHALQRVLIRVSKKLEPLFQDGILVSFQISGFPNQFNAVLILDTALIVVDTTRLDMFSGKVDHRIIK